MGVAMQRIRLDIRVIIQQTIKEIEGFINAAGNEMAEERDVIVSHMVGVARA